MMPAISFRTSEEGCAPRDPELQGDLSDLGCANKLRVVARRTNLCCEIPYMWI